jgi:hypothetical protein
LKVIKNRGCQSTAKHQRGVDVDAIGLYVRLSNWRMPVDDMLFVGDLCFKNSNDPVRASRLCAQAFLAPV